MTYPSPIQRRNAEFWYPSKFSPRTTPPPSSILHLERVPFLNVRSRYLPLCKPVTFPSSLVPSVDLTKCRLTSLLLPPPFSLFFFFLQKERDIPCEPFRFSSRKNRHLSPSPPRLSLPFFPFPIKCDDPNEERRLTP